MPVKELVVIALFFVLWFYSIYLFYRYYHRPTSSHHVTCQLYLLPEPGINSSIFPEAIIWRSRTGDCTGRTRYWVGLDVMRECSLRIVMDMIAARNFSFRSCQDKVGCEDILLVVTRPPHHHRTEPSPPCLSTRSQARGRELRICCLQTPSSRQSLPRLQKPRLRTT